MVNTRGIVVIVAIVAGLTVLWSIGAFDYLAPEPDRDWPSFFRDLTTTFVGAFVAFLLANYSQHLFQKLEIANEAKTTIEFLLEMAEDNITRLSAIQFMLCDTQYTDAVPVIRCDVDSIPACYSAVIEAQLATEIRRNLRRLQHQLQSVNGLLDAMAATDGTSAYVQLTSNELGQIANSIVDIPQLRPLADKIRHSIMVHPQLGYITRHRMRCYRNTEEAISLVSDIQRSLSDELGLLKPHYVWRWVELRSR